MVNSTALAASKAPDSANAIRTLIQRRRTPKPSPAIAEVIEKVLTAVTAAAELKPRSTRWAA